MHAYSEEDFGFVVAFQGGEIGLYAKSAARLCAEGADSEVFAPHKLKKLPISPDFHLRAPLLVWLEMTRACNLRCRHCFVAASEPQPDELSFDEVLSLLDQLKSQGVFSIVFSGGEPFARPDFPGILQHAVRLGFIIAVVTNGFLLTESVVKQIPKGNIRITISLDNLHFGETEHRSAERKLSYLQSRLLLLKSEGIACHVSATMTRENLGALRTTFSWLTEHEIGYRGIPFSPIGRGASCPELQLTTAQVKEAAELWKMDLLTERALQAGRPVLTFDQFFDFAFTLVYMARACKGARFISYIAANGDVYPCTTCAGVGEFQVGNVKTTSFREVWEESAKSFRMISPWANFTDCGKCGLSGDEYFCTNRCPPLSMLYKGSPCVCGATAYDKASLVHRTKLLPHLDEPGEKRGDH